MIDDNKDADHPPTKPVDDRLLSQAMAVRDNMESICAIKLYLRKEEWDSAAEAMQELSEETRQAIGVASTKGGIFDLDDTAAFKTAEYAEAPSATVM